MDVMRTIGDSAKAKRDRAKLDFYATPPIAVNCLLEKEDFQNRVLEPACGDGHISKILADRGYTVISSDIVKRNYDCIISDFLEWNTSMDCDIITNPPYSSSIDFVYKAMELVQTGSKVAMLLPLRFLEGKKRKELFDKYPPIRVYVSVSRITCAKDGDFDKHKGDNALAYAWFIWIKGYKGKPELGWFN